MRTCYARACTRAPEKPPLQATSEALRSPLALRPPIRECLLDCRVSGAAPVTGEERERKLVLAAVPAEGESLRCGARIHKHFRDSVTSEVLDLDDLTVEGPFGVNYDRALTILG